MKIEKGIKIPGRGKLRKSKYPWGDMDVGDSILFEAAGDQTTLNFKPCIAARSWGRANGKKFSGRKVEGGIRIWRVE